MSGDPAAAATLHLRGGRGGTAALLDDLDQLAAVLRRAGVELEDVARGVAAVARDVALSAAALPPTALSPAALAPDAWSSLAAAARVEWELAGVLLGPHGVLPCAARLEALGLGVAASAAAYRGADAAVVRLLHEIDLAAGRLLGIGLLAAAPQLAEFALAAALASRVPALRRGPAAGVSGERLLEFLARHSTLSEHLVDAAPGLPSTVLPSTVLPSTVLLSPGPPSAAGPGWLLGLDGGFAPRDPREAAALIASLGAVSPLLREPAAVATTSTPPVSGRAPAGLGDLMGRVSRMSPGQPGPGGSPIPPGTVRVERVTGPDGSRAWVVEIPGTHVWNPVTGSDPFDVTSCLHTLGGQPSAAGATVVAALRQAGASPTEPVLLVGHSLGGMTAAQLASDPAVRRSLHITHVVTAGSPIALSGVPAEVHVLSIEHSDDLVPRLDGAQNPDRPGWITASRPATDLPQPPGPGSEQSTADAHPRLAVTHDATGYARTAAQLDASTDPSLRAYRAELAAFLDRPGATAVSWDVTGRRIVPLAPTAVAAP